MIIYTRYKDRKDLENLAIIFLWNYKEAMNMFIFVTIKLIRLCRCNQFFKIIYSNFSACEYCFCCYLL